MTLTATSETSTRIQVLRVDTLRVDPTVQRKLVEARARRMADTLNLKGIGVITVSLRDDGHYYVIDGQHRRAALIAADMGHIRVDCFVYTGLSLAEEAALFRVLNQTKAPTAFDDFTKGVIAGDKDCVAINNIVREAGLTVAQLPSNGSIAAVKKLRDIYDKNGGPEALIVTLATLVDAWGKERDAFDGFVIAGLGTVFLRYGGEIDRSVLVRKLSKRQGGPLALVGDAKGLKSMRGGTVHRAMAEIVVADYNRGRRSNRLGPL